MAPVAGAAVWRAGNAGARRLNAISPLRLPAHGWQPRRHQRALWRYLWSGGKRAVEIAHRRWGKDEVALHWTAIAAHRKIATYWHMLPEAAQARKAIWEAINPHTGRRRIDEAFPEWCRDTTRENEMFIRFRSGSTWQVVGSDNFNSLIGSPPQGVVLSEWAVAQPASWAYLTPILRENGGWAIFITTPRGRNHAFRTYETARDEPDWFAEVSSIHDTGMLTAKEMAAERRELVSIYGADMGRALFEQEWLCSFDAAILGAIWGAELAEAERSGRVRPLTIDPDLPVHTAWDIGRDTTAIWFFQIDGELIRVVDYHAEALKDAPHLASVVLARGYKRGTDWFPHDAKVDEWGTGRTRIESLIAAGLNPRLVPDHGLLDGINAARMTIPRCVFDRDKCADGWDALKAYQFEWDEKLRRFKDAPRHDWASHGADAYRYLAMAWRETKKQPEPVPGRRLYVGAKNEVTLDDLFEERRRAGSRY